MCDQSEITKDEECCKSLSSPGIIEATFKHLARINGEINKMNTNQLIKRLKYYNLDTEGNDNVRRRRLKNNYRKIKLATLNINISNKLLPYYVVIDFEATCLEVNKPEYQQEIIEFPAVLISSANQEVEDTFQMYCKPVINAKLSDFCTELTGITQNQVDKAESFEHVLRCFELWLREHNLGKKQKFAIVSDGPWDMSRFLFQQCQYSKVSYPQWAKKWVNLKRSFCSFYKCKRQPLKNMLNYLGMEFEGRLHCGLDDAKNIARLLIRMIRDGANIQPNEKITNRPRYLKYDFKTQNGGNKQIGGADCEDPDILRDKMENLTVRAYYVVIENKEQLSTYERVKRERKKMEAKMKNELREKCDELNDSEELHGILERSPVVKHKKVRRKWKKLDITN